MTDRGHRKRRDRPRSRAKYNPTQILRDQEEALKQRSYWRRKLKQATTGKERMTARRGLDEANYQLAAAAGLGHPRTEDGGGR